MPNAALSLCRVCLASDINMYHIANTRYQEIFEKLLTQLRTADRRPDTVCYTCLSHLQRCCRLMNMSQRAEAILTRISLSGIQRTKENASKLSLTLQPLSVAPVQNLFSGDTYGSPQHATGNRQVIFAEETATAVGDPFVEIETNNYVTSEVVCVKIEIESEEFSDEPMVTEQLKHQTSYCCDVCSEVFSDKSKLATHMSSSHTVHEPYSCNRCGKKFIDRSKLTIHMGVHSGEQPYACDICRSSYNRKSNYTRHMKVHSGEKPYSCDVCLKAFYRKSYLIRHMTVHTGEKPYACDNCSKKFNTKFYLTRHMKVHSAENHPCDTCGKCYDKTSLAKHMSIHAGEKLYSCNLCDKKFNQQAHVASHMGVHSGEMPHACGICGIGFKNKSKLSRHMAVHAREKPFNCSVCRKKFNQKSSLTLHMKLHSGEKPFACTLCVKRFSRKHHLEKHTVFHNRQKSQCLQ